MKLSSRNNFTHGDSYLKIEERYPNIRDFSANINHKSPEHLMGKNTELLKHYPVGEEKLERSIGELFNIIPERIIATYGMTSLINYVYQLYSRKRILLIEPIFSEHRRAAEINRCNITRLFLKTFLTNPAVLKNFNYGLIAMNIPVNPTGEMISFNEMEKIIQISIKKDASVFIDQAYIDFLSKERQNELKKVTEDYQDVIVGRSITKVSGLPGIRLGFGISSHEIINSLKKIRGPWTIPEDYKLILGKWNEYQPDIANLERERENLKEELRKMKLKVLGKPEVNFLSFSLNKEIDPLNFEKKLMEMGFLIRNLGDFYGFTESDFRINIRGHEENMELVKAMRAIING